MPFCIGGALAAANERRRKRERRSVDGKVARECPPCKKKVEDRHRPRPVQSFRVSMWHVAFQLRDVCCYTERAACSLRTMSDMTR